MQKRIATAPTILLISIVMLFSARHADAADRITVAASIAPQKYFIEAVGGNRVDVVVMVSPGQAPETFEPTPAQMKKLAGAKIYFAVGVPFESVWLPKFSAVNPAMNICRTDKNIEKKPMNRHEDQAPFAGAGRSALAHDHDHPHDHHTHQHHHHDHGADDPHIWLSPPLVMIQAKHVLEALINASPSHQSEFEANYASLMEQLTALDAELRQIFENRTGGLFLVFHPSWGYFADAYGLRQVSIEIDGKEPKARELQALIAYARDAGIRTIFIQPQFSSQQAQLIAREINGSLVDADPLAENWMENIRSVAGALKGALR